MLNGHARRVAGQIRRKSTNADLDPANRKIAEEAATYLTRKAPYLDYPTALKRGWPIATDPRHRRIVASRFVREREPRR